MYPDVIIKQTTRLASPKGEGGSCQIHIFTLACPNDCAPKPIYLFWTFSSLRHHFSSWRRLVLTKWKMNLFTFTSWFNFYFLVQKHSFQCLVIVKLFNTQWATHTNVSYARSNWVRGSALRTMRRHTICQRRQSTIAHIVPMKCQRSTEATWKDILRIRTSTNSKL